MATGFYPISGQSSLEHWEESELCYTDFKSNGQCNWTGTVLPSLERDYGRQQSR